MNVIARHQVAIVGLGAWGAHALWQLAERGVDVLGIDRHQPPHGYGSSSGATRMYRTACLEHPDLVPMAQRSLRLWRSLSELSGRELVDSSGALLLGPADGHIVEGSLRAAEMYGLPVEVFEAGQARRRFPGHATLPDHHLAVLEANGGLTDVPGVITAAVARARNLGAHTATGVRVCGIEVGASKAVVETPVGCIEAEHVVVAAGGWTGSLLPQVDSVQENVRMPMTWLGADDRHELAVDRFPVFMRELDDGGVLWGHGIRTQDPAGRIKIGIEDSGNSAVFTVAAPDEMNRTVGFADWEGAVRNATSVFAGVHSEVAKVAVCQFARTPDGQFLLGALDSERRVVVAAGCNAHGFKHTAAVGEVLADLVVGAETRLPVAAFDPLRFAA